MFVAHRFRAFVLFIQACLALILLSSGLAAQGLSLTQSAPRALSASEAFVLEHDLRPNGDIVLSWRVADGHYLYRKSFVVETDAGELPLSLPHGSWVEDARFGRVEVFREDLELLLTAPTGTLSVQWQGCQEGGVCFPPQSAEISLPVKSAGITLSNEAGLMDRLGARGVPVLLAAFFGFGVALAFTPCVLPMVPILGGLLARDGAGLTRLRGFTLSLAYVVAMATAFGILGLVAGATGQNLQIALQSPVVLAAISAVFILLAVSMFGGFDIGLPEAWVARFSGASQTKRGTLGGALGLGFSSALVVGPCVTAPLAAALLYIAKTGDMLLGSAALFALGLGKGLPLVVFGTLGGRYLPRSGPWMVRVRQGFGFVFLALALWLVARLWPGPWIVAGWGLLLAALGYFLLRTVLPELTGRAGRGAVRVAATLVLIPAVVLVLTASRGAHDPLRPFDFIGPNVTDPLPWQTVSGRDAFSAALADAQGPTLIYLTADWCIICRSIERRVLPQSDVVAALEPMNRIKLDLSDFDLDGQAMLALLGAAGPPTMIFLDASLREVEGTRQVGETRPSQLIAAALRAQR